MVVCLFFYYCLCCGAMCFRFGPVRLIGYQATFYYQLIVGIFLKISEPQFPHFKNECQQSWSEVYHWKKHADLFSQPFTKWNIWLSLFPILLSFRGHQESGSLTLLIKTLSYVFSQVFYERPLLYIARRYSDKPTYLDKFSALENGMSNLARLQFL